MSRAWGPPGKAKRQSISERRSSRRSPVPARRTCHPARASGSRSSSASAKRSTPPWSSKPHQLTARQCGSSSRGATARTTAAGEPTGPRASRSALGRTDRPPPPPPPARPPPPAGRPHPPPPLAPRGRPPDRDVSSTARFAEPERVAAAVQRPGIDSAAARPAGCVQSFLSEARLYRQYRLSRATYSRTSRGDREVEACLRYRGLRTEAHRATCRAPAGEHLQRQRRQTRE